VAGAAAPDGAWYQIVENDDSLRQGDIILNLFALAFPQGLPVFRQKPAPEQKIPTEGILGDWIIMSASCDVGHTSKKYPYVLVGRVLPAISEKLGGAKGEDLEQMLEVIRRGNDPTKFLLAECQRLDPAFPRSFVQFRPHLTLPLDHLKRACVGKRLRLKPPHREAFGNWVGRGFSRVGIEDADQIPKYDAGAPSKAALALEQVDGAEGPAPALRIIQPSQMGALQKKGIADRLVGWVRDALRAVGIA